MTEDTKMILDAIGAMNQRMDRMDERMDHIEQRLEQMDKRIEHIEQHLEQVDKRIDHIEQRLGQMDERIDSSKQHLEQMDIRIAHMELHLGQMDGHMDSIDQRIDCIECIFENEVSHPIKLIAEGHADLSRKLTDSMDTFNENELLNVRMNLLETDMYLVKTKLRM